MVCERTPTKNHEQPHTQYIRAPIAQTFPPAIPRDNTLNESNRSHLLAPYVALAIVHRHKPPARVEVEHDLLELLVVLRADIDAPRLAVRRHRHAHDERLKELFLTDDFVRAAIGGTEVF